MHARLAIVLLVLTVSAGPARADELVLTQRQVPVTGNLTVAAATKIAEKLVSLDSYAEAPIHLMVTATGGSAQGVMVVADTVRSVRSPVVAVVMTQVHGAGAAVAAFADRVVVFPSAGLVVTEIDYEGVSEPKPPKEGEEAKPLEPGERLLQDARTAYLKRFNGWLAGRLAMKASELDAALGAGGLLMTAEDAVKRKVAASIVERISFTGLTEVKEEVKIVTTDKQERFVEVPTPMVQPKASR